MIIIKYAKGGIKGRLEFLGLSNWVIGYNLRFGKYLGKYFRVDFL